MENIEKYNYTLLNTKKNNFFLIEYLNNSEYYRVNLDITNNQINIINIIPRKNLKENNSYEIIEKNITEKNNSIYIKLRMNIYINNGKKIHFNVDKKFTKNKYKNIVDTFDDIDDEFILVRIKALIENKILLGNSNFIYDNFEKVYDLAHRLSKIENRIKLDKNNSNTYNYIKTDISIDRVQDFLRKNNFNLDIRKLVKNGSILFIEANNWTSKTSDGYSYYDYENKRKMIDIKNTNDIRTMEVLIHEIMHYINQPEKDNRSFTSDFLTETISYTYELIFLDELLNEEYREDVIKIMKYKIDDILHVIYEMSSILLTIKLYKKNKFNKEKIEEKIQFNDYIEEMKLIIKNDRNLLKLTWYLVGFSLSISNFICYKEDNSYIDKIHLLNDNLNTKSLDECFKILDINSYEEYLDKVLINIDKYQEYFNKRVKESDKSKILVKNCF